MNRLRLTLFTTALAACGLAACGADSPPSDVDAGAGVDQPAVDVAPVTMPRASLPTIAAAGDARMDGYGALDFGMSAAEARAEWQDGALVGRAPAGAADGCFHLSPEGQAAPDRLAFMFDNDLFVRYSATDLTHVAPGGGRIGMATEALQGLYGNGLLATPHKYVQGGQYLSVDAAGAPPARLLFETDADGNVSAWRVGVAPQIDFVEGCG